jgi:hypothetical protein
MSMRVREQWWFNARWEDTTTDINGPLEAGSGYLFLTVERFAAVEQPYAWRWSVCRSVGYGITGASDIRQGRSRTKTEAKRTAERAYREIKKEQANTKEPAKRG